MLLRQRTVKLWQRPGGYRELYRVALPLMISELAYLINMLVDRLYLTHYDTAAFAAVGPSGITYFTIAILPLITVHYMSTFVAQYRGEGRFQEARESLSTGIWLTILVYPLFLILVPLAEPMFLMFGHEASLASLEAVYFQILTLGMLPHILGVALAAYLVGWEKPHHVTISAFLLAFVNVVMGYLLIFDHGWIGGLGIVGAAYATLIGVFAELIYLAVVVALSKSIRPRWLDLRPQWQRLVRLVRHGGASGLEGLIGMTSFSIFLLLLGSLGQDALTLVTFGLSIHFIILVPMMGLRDAVSTLMGRYIGERKPHRSQLVVHNSLITGMTSAAAFIAILLLLPDVALWAFDLQGTAIEAEARLILWLIPLMVVADVLAELYHGALKGAGDTKWPMWLSVILSYGVFLTIVGFSMAINPWSVMEYWLLMTAYIAVYAVAIMIRFYGKRWTKMKVTDDPVVIDPAPVVPAPVVEPVDATVKKSA